MWWMGKYMIKHQTNINEKTNQKNKQETTDGFDENKIEPSFSTDQSTKTGKSSLQQQLEQLRKENESLKDEKNSLEIDNICLEQKNSELKTRIDDLATHYPQASILLGKKPDEQQKYSWLKNISLKKRK